MGPPRVSAFAAYHRQSLQVNGISKRKATEQGKKRKKKQKRKPAAHLELFLTPVHAKVPGPEPSIKEQQGKVLFSIPHTGAEPVRKLNKKTSVKPESALLENLASEPEVSLKPEHESNKLKKSLKPHVGPSLASVLQGLGTIQNSRERAAKLFEWMISPIPPKHFFSEIWEKSPALIQRHNLDYYKGMFSTAEFDRILRENAVQYGVNLDVTSYTDGKRETLNPPGRALPFVVWDLYKNGCSLRMLNPQAFSVTMWNFLSVLQEQFGSMCGANTYLTPPGTQGFAPHYDDIEAFVIQLEGKKHWRVYKPRAKEEVLPQFSSPNFSQEDIGDPIMDTVLEAGDLLYFPRGFIHQGDCFPDAHSLHITVSSYQKNSWADLLEKLLPASLQVAIEEDVEFREGLPLDYLEYMGVQNSDQDDSRRTGFMLKVQKLIKKLAKLAPVDAAVDQKAKEFLHDCLPPVLTEAEHSHSVHGASARWENEGIQDVGAQMDRKTHVRLLRNGIVRLCSEAEGCKLYYTTDNSRVYHKEDPKYIELDIQEADGIECLIHSYPKYVSVDSLPGENLDDKIALSVMLFEKGLLATKKPLNIA